MRSARAARRARALAHALMLLVTPRGARVPQAWGEHGYSLPEDFRRSAVALYRRAHKGNNDAVALVEDDARLAARPVSMRCRLQDGAKHTDHPI
jgi:hypothetical protein